MCAILLVLSKENHQQYKEQEDERCHHEENGFRQGSRGSSEWEMPVLWEGNQGPGGFQRRTLLAGIQNFWPLPGMPGQDIRLT